MLSRIISYLVVIPSVCAITLRAFEVDKTDAKNLMNAAINIKENYYRVDRHGLDVAKSVNATKAAFETLREAIEGNMIFAMGIRNELAAVEGNFTVDEF